MKRNASIAITGIFFATAAGAGDAEPVPVLHMVGVRPSPELAPLVFRADITSPPMGPTEMAAQGDARPGVGSGGDVNKLGLIQAFYSDPTKGNQVDLFWIENTVNPNGVEVFVDAKLLGKAPGLPAIQVPGLNDIGINKIPAGPHTFKVQAEGTSSEASLAVLDLKPFTEPANLQCASNEFVDPETGFCGMEVSWTISGTDPDFINVWIDGIFQDSFPGGRRKVFFVGVPPGPHEVLIRGFKTDSPATFYGGDFQVSGCDITCEDVPCNSVSSLEICQVNYGTEAPGNQLQLEWTNGEAQYSAGVNAYVDGTLAGSVGPSAKLALLGNLAAGNRKVGIEGNCGPDGKSTIREAVFPVKDATPHTNPVTGGLVCKYDAANTETIVSWTPADPSASLLIYVTSEGGPREYLGNGTFSTPEFIVGPTVETDTISVIFTKVIDDACYGSEVFSCSPASAGSQYIQGVCNGEGAAPAITSAIFGLNWLFLGGPTPPCQKACDADGSGAVNLTDMVYVLNFLFLSGLPPSLWGGPDPVCSTAGPEDDCEIPNPACPL